MNHTVRRLIQNFRDFPGIGPRQATRFVYYLLSREPEFVKILANDLFALTASVRQCGMCHRYSPAPEIGGSMTTIICDLCGDENRDSSTILIVEKDIDLESVRKSGVYQGMFFVLGGLLPILEPKPDKIIRAQQLLTRVKEELKTGQIKEVILALSANAEGDHTTDYLRSILTPLTGSQMRVSILGRGLSTGTELEYSDADTLRGALKNRN